MPSDGTSIADQFVAISNQIGGIEPISFLLMLVAILLGILFVAFMTIRGQGSQIRAVIANSNMVLKSSEERHERDIERFSKRLDDAEARADAAEARAMKAEKRADQKDREAREANDAKLSLMRVYEEKMIDMRREIEGALQNMKDQQERFDEKIGKKNEEIEKLEKEVVELGDENSELKDEIEALKLARDSLSAELTTSKNSKKVLMKQMKEDDLAHAKEIEDMNEQIEFLNSQLKEAINSKDDKNDNSN